MFSAKTIIMSMVAFAVFLIITSALTDRGMDKIQPMLDESKRMLVQNQKRSMAKIRESMEAMGYATGEIEENTQEFNLIDNPKFLSSIDFEKPIGTWAGTKIFDGDHVLYVRFDEDKYWFLMEGPLGKKYRESGQYICKIDKIIFKPGGESQYSMDYFLEDDELSLYGDGFTYGLQRGDNLDVEF
jgi:hypothetical protein